MLPFAASFTALVVGAAILLFLRLARGSGGLRLAVAVVMGMSAVGSSMLAGHSPRQPPPPVRVTEVGEWVSSRACRSCHPGEYASWHDSYHRTMTQTASPGTVLAPLASPAALDLDGQRYAMRRQENEVWATVVEGASQVDRRVAMTTGSHHYQAYWTEGDVPGDLRMFPFVYLLGREPRWIPRRDAFVEPPDAEVPPARWGSNCIQCHATAGRPGASESVEGTEVAELGIACEACHGPGAAHVARYRDPITRYAAHASDRPDPTIVNPSRLVAERASMICGACHSFTLPRDEEDFWAHGYTRSFRPGQDLLASHLLLTGDALRAQQAGSPTVDTDPDNLFYDDGTVRIGGREYSGMVLSACFLRGEGKMKLSCLSCHSMHDSEPDDQLTRGREGDAACASCHDPARYAGAPHTHHAQGSPGSRCVECHMPKTAYALLKSIRSHRVDSPAATSLGGSDRPTRATCATWTDRSPGRASTSSSGTARRRLVKRSTPRHPPEPPGCSRATQPSEPSLRPPWGRPAGAALRGRIGRRRSWTSPAAIATPR